ncbi:MAG: oligosaccharide flippase family protein [Clostridiales bacterium]|nr:oligosaccharide flippase family protein [Clostridiales bacterium]
MDKKRSVLNISVSILSRILLLVAALFVRRLLIQKIGNDVNGLHSLYADIIGMLAVAELGIGSAIIYSMYSPIVGGDRKKVTALYGLYKRLYRIIGGVILGVGLLITPFLPVLIRDYSGLQEKVNVYLTYILTLLSVGISYFFSAKTSLIEAHKDNYITTAIHTVSKLIMYGLQMAAILMWRSFTIFVVCSIIGTLCIWGLTEIVVRRKYGDILSDHATLDKETEKEIIRNAKAMFLHKIGTIMVNGVDSLIISSFIGVVILGKYNNYTLIATVVSGTIALCFTPLTSIIGHLCVSNDAQKKEQYFHFFYSMNYALGFLFFLGYYAIIDGLVTFCFGSGLQIAGPVVFIITLHYFTMYMRNAALLFRNASGAFYYDRWKPIVEGITNLILSLLLVNILSEDMRIVGVVFATVITTLFICHVVEPFILFRHVFMSSPRTFYIRNYLYVAWFLCFLIGMSYIKTRISSEMPGVSGFLANGAVSVILSIGAIGLISLVDKEFRGAFRSLRRNLKVS